MKGKLLKAKGIIPYYNSTSRDTTTRINWLYIDDLLLVIENNEISNKYNDFVILCKFGLGCAPKYNKHYEVVA